MKLQAILAHFDGVQPDGSAFLAICPSHGDHDPSLRIARGENNSLLLKCRSQACSAEEICKAAGIQMRSLFNVTGWQAAGIPEQAVPAADLPAESVTRLAVYVDETLQRLHDGSELAGSALEYLRRRFGITPELAADLRIGLDPGSDAIDFEYTKATFRQVPRITVPFIDDFDGVARGLQGRALTSHRVRWSGLYAYSGKVPWHKHAYLHGGANTDVVIITEGPGDGLTAVGAGHDAIVVAGASNGNQSLAEMLAPHLQGRRVILAGDADNSGSAFSTRLGEALASHGIDTRRLALPGPGDDLSKWYERDGVKFAGLLYQAIRDAVPFAVRETVNNEEEDSAGGELDYVARHPHTDLGNTKRLYDRLNGLVRYTDAAGFFLWDGSYWAHDGRSQVRTEAQAVADDVYYYAQSLPADHPYKKAWLKFAHTTQSSASIAAMVRDLEAMSGVHCDINDFDASPDLLAVQNGVLDLRRGELVDPDPEMKLSRRLGVTYDPDAKAPRWSGSWRRSSRTTQSLSPTCSGWSVMASPATRLSKCSRCCTERALMANRSSRRRSPKCSARSPSLRPSRRLRLSREAASRTMWRPSRDRDSSWLAKAIKDAISLKPLSNGSPVQIWFKPDSCAKSSSSSNPHS